MQSIHPDPNIRESKRTKELLTRFATLDRKIQRRLFTKTLTHADRTKIKTLIPDSTCFYCDISRVNGGHVSDVEEDEDPETQKDKSKKNKTQKQES
jgi:hypothetical protein